MTREEARHYLQSSGFSAEQIATIEQAFKQEQKSGKWTLMYEPKNMVVCSECGKCAYIYQNKTSAFCPHCGCRMVDEQERSECMKLIIDINDNEYIGIKEYPDNVTSYPVTIHLYDAVKNGIPLPTEIQALQQIRDIVNSPVYIQEDVLRYQMICDVLNMADSEVNK